MSSIPNSNHQDPIDPSSKKPALVEDDSKIEEEKIYAHMEEAFEAISDPRIVASYTHVTGVCFCKAYLFSTHVVTNK